MACIGPVKVTVVEQRAERSRQIIREGKHNWLCEDWACPLKNHCGQHFGLSKRYAAMLEPGPRDALVRPRLAGEDRCEFFVQATRDHFAESLGQQPAFAKALHPDVWAGEA